MPQSVIVIATLLGGLGLFLVAMDMMTDGLKLASGHSLRRLLSNWTSTTLRGVMTSMAMTAIVQSSSAVTVASLSFVNAGVLKMRQALGVIYGANIGTTMTAWLVAVIGFKLNIHAFALPAIGIGAFLSLTRSKGKRLGLGRALVGFGLFFLGIDTLQSAFEGLVNEFDLGTVRMQGATEVVIYVLIGIVMTILTQSSSAAIAITITAAGAEIFGLYAAAAMVIGANVGTTSTAILAALGATPNAKRLAAAQVIFNLGTAVVALALLPLMFVVVEHLQQALSLTPNIGMTLALFHTVFNCLGVALVIPLNGRLVRLLNRMFTSKSESLATPRHLDKTTVGTPSLAVGALSLELQRNARHLGDAARAVLVGNPREPDLAQNIDAINQLSHSISAFIVQLERSALSEQVTRELSALMRVDQYFLTCAGQLATALETRQNLHTLPVPELDQAVSDIQQQSADFLTASTHVDSDHYFEDWEANYLKLMHAHKEVKQQLLTAGTIGQISLQSMMNNIDFLGEIKSLNEHWYKAIRVLAKLEQDIKSDGKEAEAVEPESASPSL